MRAVLQVMLPCVFLLLFLPTLPFAGNKPSATIPLTTAERDWLQAHPVIRLAPDPEFRPIEYFNKNGQYEGAAADHVRLLEKKLGIRFAIVQLRNWDEVMEKFRSHDIDLLGAVAATPARRQFMLFSDTLVEVPGGIFARKGSDRILSIADLKEMRVAVVSNYMAHDYLRSQHPEIRLEVVPDVASGLSKVSLGEVDAYVENMANATYYLQTGGITNLRLAGYTSFPYQWGIGIRSDWPELQGILNKGLAAITKEERQAIINQWIYVEGQPWKPSGKTILTGLAIAAIALLAGILARNYSLRHEIARRVLAEEQVRQLNVALEQRVAERTAELEQSNRDLESFSYSVSHDLRAPLRLIGTSAAILQDDYSGSFDEEGERLLQILTRNTRKMELLIDDLLLFSRVRTQDLKISSIDMTALAREVFEELSASEGEYAVSCTIPQLIPALGEPGMIRQVLVNLLANAIKFSDRREDPRIEVGCIAGEQATVYYVKDNGIGFDMQYAERLFEVFSRLNASHEFEGTGIGLAIVKRVIDKHGGKVWAEGKEGEGATFYFSLPN